MGNLSFSRFYNLDLIKIKYITDFKFELDL